MDLRKLINIERVLMLLQLPIYIVDAFTDTPFTGNQAGVCVLVEQDISDVLMQNIATELNLSETAFLKSINTQNVQQSDRFKLRWFTPTQEVKMCGHATLASAHILFSELKNSSDKITFETMSGPLYVERKNNAISMNFPIGNPQKIDPITEYLKPIGLQPYVVKEWYYCKSTRFLMLILDSDYQIREIKPDFGEIVNINQPKNIEGLIVTVKGQKFDFLSRFFCPWIGINEDPVTGAAHTVLAKYWQEKLNKNILHAKQVSQRSGTLKIEIDKDRVNLLGSAITMLRGKFAINDEY